MKAGNRAAVFEVEMGVGLFHCNTVTWCCTSFVNLGNPLFSPPGARKFKPTPEPPTSLPPPSGEGRNPLFSPPGARKFKPAPEPPTSLPRHSGEGRNPLFSPPLRASSPHRNRPPLSLVIPAKAGIHSFRRRVRASLSPHRNRSPLSLVIPAKAGIHSFRRRCAHQAGTESPAPPHSSFRRKPAKPGIHASAAWDAPNQGPS